ncbi:restriction endonuclease subunit S [Parabacteroides distasonis]|uniref:EcoKI restriction-modification system protein HsdS n=1 Tax=Parabacteroides distasonis TaxID=823 RepID=A0A173UFX6_PARDI|nr:restriction endonuclease subunit S [Parabacteroides distasonis]CUN13983.1 EcoKI restriction-modification system protein HsdS [Parabacteroides distasonis]
MADNNENKVLNVPPLRFPEFSGEWEKCKFGDIATGFDYGMNAAAKPFDGENKYIRITDIDEASSTYNDTDIVSPDGSLTDNYVVNDRDILLARTGASTGKSYLYRKSDGKLYYAGFLIRANVTEHNPYFVFSQLHTHRYWRWVSIMSARSGQPGINSQEYSSFPIFTTSLHEENKIASLLSRLDERIATQNKIIEKYESLIQAMCDTLIESDQHKVELAFSDFGKSYSGLSGKSAGDFGEGCPYITYMNVYQNQIIDTTNIGLVKINGTEQQSVVHYGDILFTLSSETAEEVGMGAVYLGDTYPLYLNSFCFGIHIIDENKIFPPFLAFYVSTRSFRKVVFPLAQGSTRFNLQKNDFMKKGFSFPTVERQRNIYSALKTYSDKLSVEKSLAKLLCKQKNHLLSQLFI